MTTYTARQSGIATDAGTWTPSGVPGAGDEAIVSGVTVTYPDLVTGQPAIASVQLGGATASALEFQSSDATLTNYANVLNAQTTVNAGASGDALSTVQFAGGLQVGGMVNALGTTLIDGRAIAFSQGTIGAVLLNSGDISAEGGNLTITLSNNTDIDGNTVATATASPAVLQNVGKFDALEANLNIQANVITGTAPAGTIPAGAVPSFSISQGGKIEFGGSVQSGQAVIFDRTIYDLHQTNAPGPGNETLQLDSPSTFAGAIGSFGQTAGNTIDFRNQTLGTVAYSNGVFSAQATAGGSASATLLDSISMGTTGAVGVQLSSDGVGGTNVVATGVDTGSQTGNISAYRNDATVTPATSSTATLSEAVTLSGTTTTYLNSNQINFADGTDYYGAGTPGGQAALLFYGLLGRAPDASSLGNFAAELQRGTSAAIVAQQIVSSAEYQSVSPQSEAAQVGNLYQRLLGRTASASELQYWSGQPVANAAAGIAGSAEAASVQNASSGSAGLAAGVFGANPAAVTVQDAYQTVFGRAADRGGLGYWTGQLEAGTTQSQLLASFIDSREFQSNMAVGSNAGFVMQIQTNTEGSSDQSGLSYWTAQLNAGAVSRADVAAAYANSQTLAIREQSTITAHGIVTAS